MEVHTHAGLHDNVVGLRGVAKDGDTTMLVMEYCQRGTLDHYLKETFGQGPSDRCQLVRLLPLLRHIARGVYHLHTRSPPVLHRDIKPSNIFISACCCCVLCLYLYWLSARCWLCWNRQPCVFEPLCYRPGADSQGGGLWHESHARGRGGRLRAGADPDD